MTNKVISKYMAKIGSKGGKKSRRILTSEDARRMVAAREKKREQKKLSEDLSSLSDSPAEKD